MRVSIMGQAAFGEAVFKRLRDSKHRGRRDKCAAAEGGRPADALWAAAEAAGLPAIATGSLKEPAGMDAWRGLNADLCVMAFVTDIIPDEALTCRGWVRSSTTRACCRCIAAHRR